MNIEDIIQRAGLSEGQQILYQALLSHPNLTVAELARTANLNRPLVYEILPELEKLGLVSKFQIGKRTHFSAEHPNHLRNLITRTLVELDSALPALTERFEQNLGSQQVSVYQGKDNIQNIFSDLIHSLKKGEVFYRYSARNESTSGERYLPKDYREVRDLKQLQRFVITNSSVAKQKKPRLERDVKVIPDKFGLFNDNVTVIIYENKMALIDYSSDTATVIDNPKIATFQIKLFKILHQLL